MIFEELELKGCFKVQNNVFEDHRGSFLKVFEKDIYQNFVNEFIVQEEFYSVSHKGVFRGLHFQAKPYDHNKVVYCVKGRVKDYFLDIRKNSTTYGKFLSIELSGNDGTILYLPKGIAHGFVALEDNSILVYKTDSKYSPKHDKGVHFSACNIDIEKDGLVISERDKSFPLLEKLSEEF